MTGKALAILAAVVLVGAAIATYFLAGWPTALEDQDAARAVVEQFGTKMQHVNVLADKTLAADAMSREYGPLVAPALLTKWQNDPTQAPGRVTSSPWPDHIAITGVERESRSRYIVGGQVVEVTNEGGALEKEPREAARRPITLAVEEQGGSWRIVEVTLGAYPGDGNWISAEPTAQDLIYLYPEALPTSFITASEWPPLVEEVASNPACKEGPVTAADGPEKRVEKHTVGDREYCVTLSEEGAAGSTYRSYEYAFEFGGFPYRIAFTLRYPQCANYDEPQRGACTSEQANYSVDGLVDRIAQTVQAVPEK
jgi:hypothetical protein